jgi:fused signal recognition particle receptor
MGFFSKIFKGLKKTKEAIGSALKAVFTRSKFDDEFFEELEEILICADCGLAATEQILDELRKQIKEERLREPKEGYEALREIIAEQLGQAGELEIKPPAVIMIVGVNGVGKTTQIGKLAHKFRQEKKSVLIAAADTFRAAASDQLSVWAERSGVRIIKHAEGADPAAVVFDAIASAKAGKMDILLIDTAGRLHNKKNLMEELKKIGRIIDREHPDAQHLNLIVLDATTGQNALSQVHLFDEAVALDGIILTKIDGTAKGGVVLALASEFEIPVKYLGVGEGIDDLEDFDAKSFAEGII